MNKIMCVMKDVKTGLFRDIGLMFINEVEAKKSFLASLVKDVNCGDYQLWHICNINVETGVVDFQAARDITPYSQLQALSDIQRVIDSVE